MKIVQVIRKYRPIAPMILCSAVLLSWYIPGFGQVNQFPIQINGRVTHYLSNEPITGANIQIVGTTWGTTTDPNGYFEFRAVPEGTYHLTVSHVAYHPEQFDIRIQPGIPEHLTITLQPLIHPLPDVQVLYPTNQEDPVISKTIIERKVIERSGAGSVGDLLADHSMLFVKEHGGVGGSQLASIRGSDPNQVVVVVDGRRLNAPGYGEVDLSTIPVEGIERIEIIRGPSLEHGGDAVGGVIRIITRSIQNASERRIQAGTGSFGLRQARFYLSQKGNPAVAFNGSLTASRNDYKYTNRLGITPRRKNADMDSDNLFWKTQGQVMGWRLTLTASQYRIERGIPGDLDQLTPNARLKQRRRDIQFSGKHVTPKWELTGLVYGGEDRAHHQNPDALIPLDATHTEQNAGVKTTWELHPLHGFQFYIDHETRWDGFESPSIESGNVERWSHGAVAQIKHRMNLPNNFPMTNLTCKGAVRVDKLTNLREYWTYQTGCYLAHRGELSYHIRGNIGTAFRPPTFTSLFWKEDVFARGNPDLGPETSLNREIGAGLSWSRRINLNIDIAGFWRDTDDIILWRRGFDGRWSPYNVSQVKTEGIEVTTAVSPQNEWARIEYTGTFLKAINHSGESNYDNKELPYRPRQVSRLTCELNWNNWWWNYNIQWVSRRYIRESNSIPLAAAGMGPYRLMDVSIGNTMSLMGSHWRIQLEIRNITNIDYQVVERSPMPGRVWRTTLSVEFP